MAASASEYVYALYNFDAENPDEVSFRVGEQIAIVEKDDAYGDGWFQGTNLRGETGLFPFSYTTYDRAAAQKMLDGSAVVSAPEDVKGTETAYAVDSAKQAQQPSDTPQLSSADANANANTNANVNVHHAVSSSVPEQQPGTQTGAEQPGVMRSTMADIDNAITELHSDENGRKSQAGSVSTDNGLDNANAEHDYAARAAARAALARNAQKSLAAQASQNEDGDGPWRTGSLDTDDGGRDPSNALNNVRHISLGTGVTPLAYLEMSDESEDDADDDDADVTADSRAFDARSTMHSTNETGTQHDTSSGVLESVAAKVAAPVAAAAGAVGSVVGLSTSPSTATEPIAQQDSRATPSAESGFTDAQSASSAFTAAQPKTLESIPEMPRQLDTKSDLISSQGPAPKADPSPILSQESEQELSLPGGFVPDSQASYEQHQPKSAWESTYTQVPPTHNQVPSAHTQVPETPPLDVRTTQSTSPAIGSRGVQEAILSDSSSLPMSDPQDPFQQNKGTSVPQTAISPTFPSAQMASGSPANLTTTDSVRTPAVAPIPAAFSTSAVSPPQKESAQPTAVQSPNFSASNGAPTTNPEDWTVDEVVAWAKSKKYDQQTIDKLIEHEISGDALLAMDINLLKEIEIVAFGRRFHLANGIKELRAQAAGTTVSAMTSPVPTSSAAFGIQSAPASAPLTSTSSAATSATPPPASAPYLSSSSSTYPTAPSTASARENSIATPPTSDWSPYNAGIPTSPSYLGGNTKGVRAEPLYLSGTNLGGNFQLAPPAHFNGSSHAQTMPSSVSSNMQSSIRAVEPSTMSTPKKQDANLRPLPSTSPRQSQTAKYVEDYGTDTKSSLPTAQSSTDAFGSRPERPARKASTSSSSSRRLTFPEVGRNIFGPRKEQLTSADSTPVKPGRAQAPNKAQISLPVSNSEYVAPGAAGIGGAAAAAGTSAIRRTSTEGPAVPAKSSAYDSSPLVLHKIAPVEMQGWIKKKGERYNAWNSRYIALKGHDLIILRDPAAEKVKGHINLRGYKVVSDENTSFGRYGFKIVHESERPHFFSMDDPVALRNWMKNIMKASIDRDLSQPVISSYSNPTISLEEARRRKPRPPSPGSRQRAQKDNVREGRDQLTAKDENVLYSLDRGMHARR
ncbi:hypothetical protein MPSI1_001675 [Malassezia psittaci]|uniref:Uncharacterized protein n=1 Tax=Malassezia psittaci TaxID=1821823 RepID=A0AAF0FAP8_9BASI|nr:hypothetical protein MPSI1_001675 [Malassezia psittaci]